MTLDLDPIRQRADRLAALADQAATGLRGDAYVTAVALAANLSAADVPDLLAKVEQQRTELRDTGNDLLDVRGILSPNGYPRRVPMELVPTVAPAVKWLADEADRLRADIDDRDSEMSTLRQDLDLQTKAAWDNNAKVAELTAEVERLRREWDRLVYERADLREQIDRLRAKLDEPCGSCHPCTNWADETWRRAARKPPTVQRWDDVMAELAETRTQRDTAKAIAGELRDDRRAADETNADLLQHIAAIRAEATA